MVASRSACRLVTGLLMTAFVVRPSPEASTWSRAFGTPGSEFPMDGAASTDGAACVFARSLDLIRAESHVLARFHPGG